MTVGTPAVKLSADLIEAFAGMFISPRYDSPRPTPTFHREAWALYASDVQSAIVIAPRDHAKSTGLTTVYTLAEVCWRTSDYVILVGSTEEGSAEQLGNIVEELTENEELIKQFKIGKFIRTSAADVIVECTDGHRFRIIAKGAEQRIRGRLWKGKRPNLIVADDQEDDEQVENVERRAKFRRWFFRAAKQALSKTGKIRVHGTILHEDSLLARLIRCPKCKVRTTDKYLGGGCPKCGAIKVWSHLYYKAHQAFDDFSNRLWPERWTEEQLRSRRQEFIDDDDTAGYAQEFLNDPQDSMAAFLRREDFLPMADADYEEDMRVNAGWDFAVSKADLANRTSCTVAGQTTKNILNFLDFKVGRWNPTVSPAEQERGEKGWIDLMFEVEERYHPECHFVEGGTIWNSVKNVVTSEMHARGVFLNIVVLNPVKDKAVRGLGLKKRHRAGATKWNTRAEGYEGAKEECLKFTGSAAARLDDQFDSAATVVIGFDSLAVAPEEEDFFTPDEEELEKGFWMRKKGSGGSSGRSAVTGY